MSSSRSGKGGGWLTGSSNVIGGAVCRSSEVMTMLVLFHQRGELLSWFITAGNVDDRRPVPGLARKIWGKLFGDKGYLSSPLKLRLREQGVELLTKVKKNMKPQEISAVDKILLRNRSIVETVFDQLKNISQIEHSRHRSLWNFLVNIIAGLAANTWREKKPHLNYNVKEFAYAC